MRHHPPLDFAEIVLSRTRSRCELFVSYNGVREKLASAQARPFLAHLRAAELQFERGNGVIRLEPPRRRFPNSWFTKSTLERFVHFVNFPEVLERVKDIGDELRRLNEVHAALSKTFSKDDDRFGSRDAPFPSSDLYPGKNSLMTVNRNVNEKAVETSKRQLLRAVDSRLAAVNQELHMTLSDAMSAGFDKGALSDLIKFAQHFGAERLRDACLQILDSSFSERMNMSGEYFNSQSGDDSLIDTDMSVDSSTEMEVNSETEITSASVNSVACDSCLQSESFNTWDSNPDVQANRTTRVRGRWGPPERIQISFMEPELHDSENPSDVSDVEEDGNSSLQHTIPSQNKDDEMSKSKLQLEKRLSFGQENSSGNSGTFFSHLQKMVKQIEARKLNEDQGMHFASMAIDHDSQICEGKSLRVSGSESNTPKDIHATVISDIRTVSVMRPQDREDSTTLGSSSLVTCGKQELERAQKAESIGLECVSGERAVDIQDVKDTQDTQSTDQLDEPVSTSTKRISVQAAISLFESKIVAEPVVRKLVRQDSLKGSTSQKTVVRRWSRGGSADNALQENVSKLFPPKDAKETEDVERASMDNQTVSGIRDATNNSETPGFQHEKLTRESMCMQRSVSNHMVSNVFPSHEPTTQKQSHASVDLSNQLIGGWQNEFKLELEKSLARKNRNHVDMDASNLMADPQESQISESLKREHVASILKTSDLIPNSLAQDVISESLQSKPLPVLASADRKDPKDVFHSHAPKISYRKHGSESDSSTKTVSKVHTTEISPTRTASPYLAKSLGDAVSSTKSFQEQLLKVLPSKSVVDITNSAPQKSRKVIREPRDVQSVKACLKHEGDLKYMDSRSSKPILYESVTATSKKDKTNSNVSITSKNDSSMKGTNTNKLGHEMGTNNGASVDLYMQALVVMIDNHHQSTIHSSDNEYVNEQEGRLYEEYQKLRDARQLKENPAKRVEREARLKYMKATLDKRKIEMDTGVKQNSKYTKEKINAGKVQIQKPQAPRQPKEPEMTSITLKGHTTMDQAQTSKKSVSNLQKSSKAASSFVNTSVVLSNSKSPLGMTRRKSDPKARSENGISRCTHNEADFNDVNKIAVKQSSNVLQVATETRTLPVQQNRTEFMVTDMKTSMLRGIRKGERITPTMHSQKIKHEELSNDCKVSGTSVKDLRNPLRSRATRASTLNVMHMETNSLKEQENQSDSTEEDSDVFVDATSDERVLSMDDIDQHTSVPEEDRKVLGPTGFLRQVSEAIIRKMQLHENAYDFGNN